RVKVGIRGGINFAAHEGVELADADVEAARRDDAGEVALEVELREVDADAVHLAEALGPVVSDSRAGVEAREVAEQPGRDEPGRIVAGEEIDAVADVPLILV